MKRIPTSHASGSITILAVLLVCFLAWEAQGIILNFNDVDAVVASPDDYNYNPETGTGTYNDPGTSIVELSVDGSNADFFTGNGWQVSLHTSGMMAYEGALQFAFNSVISAASGSWSSWGFLAAGVYGQIHAIGETWYYGLRQDLGGGSFGYGWLEVERNASTTWTILGSGFNNGGEILAGEQEPAGPGDEGGGEGGSVVPEPNALSFFVIGTMMLMFARGKRFRFSASTSA
jgi:hypothetical protein